MFPIPHLCLVSDFKLVEVQLDLMVWLPKKCGSTDFIINLCRSDDRILNLAILSTINHICDLGQIKATADVTKFNFSKRVREVY